MKVVRLENNIVKEIIPEYALPVEKWYGPEFASKCKEAPDEVEQRWVYNEETQIFCSPESLIKIEDAMKAKSTELSTACNLAITQGIDVETSNGQDHFNLSLEDQSNINNLFRVVELGGTEYPYQADNGTCSIYTAEDIAKIYIATQSHITQQLTYYHALVEYIKTLEDIETVDGIYYGIELPEEYQADVEAKLAIAQAQMEAIVARLNQISGNGTES